MNRPSFLRKNNFPAKRQTPVGKPDLGLLFVIISLSVFGAIMVYSGSVLVAVRYGNPPYFYFLRQVVWVIFGFAALVIFYKVDYKRWAALSLPILIGCIGLLILVLIVNYNSPIHRWINIGPFDLQATEVTKLGFLLYLSAWLGKQHDVMKVTKEAIRKHLVSELLPFVGLTIVICALILVEPDMDTTIMLGLTSFIVYFISGNDSIHLIGSVVTGAVFGVMAFITTFLASYRISRFATWIDFWKLGYVTDIQNKGFQMQQILVAVASGGLFGVGFGESRQKFGFLTNTAFTDTIFAIFAEEWGLVGCIILISLFVYILLKGYRIARNAPDKTGFLLAISITTWLVLQALLHIAANVALIPINGNTLTFLSYGGSSTVVNLAACGILLNISRYSHKAEPKVSEAQPKNRLKQR